MADSLRKQILDAVVNILNASTGTQKVIDRLESPFEDNAHDYPKLMITDRDTDIERLAFKSTGSIDKEAMIELQIRGVVHDRQNNTATKRTNLIRDIQQALVTSSTLLNALNSLIFDIEDVSIETDDGLLDNYSIFDVIYRITYHYNHLSP